MNKKNKNYVLNVFPRITTTNNGKLTITGNEGVIIYYE